jgi:hypothetical protein
MDTYLDPINWHLEESISSKLEGASPGFAQELSSVLHPHLKLDKIIVYIL